MNIYKWIWSKIGGRPWTYIMRDFYHEVEYAIIIGVYLLGFFCHNWLSNRDITIILISVTVGYILGHLFWGKRWKKGQEGK